MSQIYLEVGSKEEAMAFLAEAKKKTGMLKDVSLEKVNRQLSMKEFPIRIPVNLDGVLNLCANPVLKKMFGKAVEKKTLEFLTTVVGAG